MLIKLGVMLIIGLVFDLLNYQKRGNLSKSIVSWTITWTLLLTILLIYVIDKIDGQYVWIAFLVGGIFFILLQLVLKQKIRNNLIQGFGIIMLGGFLAFITAVFRYELQHQFFQPSWSPDGKQIVFFMEKALYRYRLGWPLSQWSPDRLWHKYYLCTMDYDGGNFKVVKETEIAGRVIWPGEDIIVFSEEKRGATEFNGKVINTITGSTHKIHPDGTGMENLWQWDEKSEYQDVLWLTPDSNYLIVVKPDQGWKYGIFDRREKKIKKELPYKGKIYGSYKDNRIAINDEHNLRVIDLDTLVTKEIDWNKNETFDKLLADFNWGSLSPDRSMYAREGSIRRTADKKLVADFYIKPKRSYLFNIFGE